VKTVYLWETIINVKLWKIKVTLCCCSSEQAETVSLYNASNLGSGHTSQPCVRSDPWPAAQEGAFVEKDKDGEQRDKGQANFLTLLVLLRAPASYVWAQTTYASRAWRMLCIVAVIQGSQFHSTVCNEACDILPLKTVVRYRHSLWCAWQAQWAVQVTCRSGRRTNEKQVSRVPLVESCSC